MNDLEVRLFVERDGGYLESYQHHSLNDFGGQLPAIGDEIPDISSWIGSAADAERHGFLVVKRRVFIKDRGVALVCQYKQATPDDYELF